MTDRELMQQALEALEYEAERGYDDGYRPLRDALRERLAQPERIKLVQTGVGIGKPEQEPAVKWDASAPLVMQLPPVFQQPESCITFHPGDPMKEVMRIDRHGVKINPEFTVDEATQHVLNTLTAHIQHTVNHAVAAEREACAVIADAAEPYKAADLIRARGRA